MGCRDTTAVLIAALFILLGPGRTVPAHAAAGDLDLSFGTDGKVTTGFGGRNKAFAVAVQTDDKIVVVGTATSFHDFTVVRYNPDGSLDSSFDGDGIVTTDFGARDDSVAVAIQSDGKIVVAGSTAPGQGHRQFALTRYHTDGSLDTSFDGDGKLTTDFGASTEAFALAIQTDGRILAAGRTSTPSVESFALARYNPDGSLDTGFDGDGTLMTDFGGIDMATGVAIQADGKIIAVGAGGPSNDFALARYNPDGSLDTSFDGDGRQTTDFGGFDRAADVAIQADGKIVAVGVPGSGSFALARYNPDGSLDMGFGIGGKLTTDFGDPSDVGNLCPPARNDCSSDIAEDVAILSSGRKDHRG